jgi:hypothetical protein
MSLFKLLAFCVALSLTITCNGASTLPEEFSKLKLGMNWNAVLLILPTARDGWADFDKPGSGTPIKDQPRSSLECWSHKPEKTIIMTMFEEGILDGIIIGYSRKDKELADAIRSELEQKLGEYHSSTTNEKDHLQIIQWKKDGVFYDLCIPEPGASRGSSIALRVLSESKAKQLEKMKTEQGAAANP